MLPLRNKLGSRMFLSLTTLLLLLATLGVGLGSEYLIRIRTQDNFRLQVVETSADLQARLDSYGQLILGTEAFVTLNNEISLEGINAYTEGIRLKRDFEGVSSIAIVRGIRPEELAEFGENLQVEVAELSEGRITTLDRLPDPNETTPDQLINNRYYLLQYIGPAQDNSLAISGINLAREPKRREAIVRALESEKSIASENLELATDVNGFLLFKKIETNDGQPTDLIALSFRSSDFYRELLKDLINTQDIKVTLSEQDTGTVLFEEGNILNPFFSEEIQLDFGGRKFTITLQVDKYFRQIEGLVALPYLLAGIVGITSSLILMFVINLNKSKEDTEKLAAVSVSKAERLQDQIQTILDNTSIMVYVKNIDGKYQLVNKEFTRLVGGNTEDMVGKTDFDIFPAAVAARIVENDRKVLNNRSQMRFEEAVTSQQGEQEIYYSQKFPLLNAQNEVYAIGGVSTNVTEQKQSTKKLEAQKSELERVNNMMIDRELKMIELKEKIKELEAAINQEQKGESENE